MDRGAEALPTAAGSCTIVGMRLGLALPQFGPFADPALIPLVAAEAEALGFETLWAGER